MMIFGESEETVNWLCFPYIIAIIDQSYSIIITTLIWWSHWWYL